MATLRTKHQTRLPRTQPHVAETGAATADTHVISTIRILPLSANNYLRVHRNQLLNTWEPGAKDNAANESRITQEANDNNISMNRL